MRGLENVANTCIIPIENPENLRNGIIDKVQCRYSIKVLSSEKIKSGSIFLYNSI